MEVKHNKGNGVEFKVDHVAANRYPSIIMWYLNHQFEREIPTTAIHSSNNRPSLLKLLNTLSILLPLLSSIQIIYFRITG